MMKSQLKNILLHLRHIRRSLPRQPCLLQLSLRRQLLLMSLVTICCPWLAWKTFHISCCHRSSQCLYRLGHLGLICRKFLGKSCPLLGRPISLGTLSNLAVCALVQPEGNRKGRSHRRIRPQSSLEDHYLHRIFGLMRLELSEVHLQPKGNQI